MPKFTIGIPTFNRAALLPAAIESALSQSHHHLEIIVSDNASTDKTAEVVRKFGQRVRYFRNESNIGAAANFFRLVELASGDFFSWLQDDDCIFGQFAERAVSCLTDFPAATVYGAYAAVAGNLKYLANSWLYGPPLALDWASGTPRAVPGDLIAPLSLCVSVAIPPVVAFRTAALKDCIPRCNRAIPLFIERTILADVASKGQIMLDPTVAGVFRAHAKQGFRVMQTDDPGALRHQWLQMARELDAIAGPCNGDWRRRLADVLAETSDGHRRNWEVESQKWPTDIALCREMRSAILAKAAPTRIPLSPSGLARAGARAVRAMLPNILS